jgi:hypothetical protein
LFDCVDRQASVKSGNGWPTVRDARGESGLAIDRRIAIGVNRKSGVAGDRRIVFNTGVIAGVDTRGRIGLGGKAGVDTEGQQPGRSGNSWTESGQAELPALDVHFRQAIAAQPTQNEQARQGGRQSEVT